VFGLTDVQIEAAKKLLSEGTDTRSLNRAARLTRDSSSGLLVLYPISRHSGYDEASSPGDAREPLYADPDGGSARDLIGLAVSFPKAAKDKPSQSYVEGTAGWRPVL